MQVVDMFAGGGGESTGIHQAAEEMGMGIKLLAINHWERAVETHAANHPWAEHVCESIQNVDPVRAVPGGRVGLLWASPECTHHSNARGGRPRSDQSRASAWLVLKWLCELYVDRVIVENVPEFLSWGPLGADGRPLASARGQTFRAWVGAMESLGYRVDWRLLCAADYGTPTTRRRLFVQAVRGRKRIVWPEATHADGESLLGTRPWVPARDVIDWVMPSESIHGRRRPLAEATLRRIEEGIRRYWGDFAEPFLVVLRGTGTVRPVDVPLPAVTAGGGNLGLVEPFVLATGHRSSVRLQQIDAPLSTVVTKAEHCLVEPFVIGQQSGAIPRAVSAPLPTVATAGAVSLCEPFVVQYYGQGGARETGRPLDTVTCRDRFGLVQGGTDRGHLDIRFRMLQPHELAGAQGFPRGYWFAGTKTEQVRQIGNAVPCPVARAIARESLMEGRA